MLFLVKHAPWSALKNVDAFSLQSESSEGALEEAQFRNSALLKMRCNPSLSLPSLLSSLSLFLFSLLFSPSSLHSLLFSSLLSLLVSSLLFSSLLFSLYLSLLFSSPSCCFGACWSTVDALSCS